MFRIESDAFHDYVSGTLPKQYARCSTWYLVSEPLLMLSIPVQLSLLRIHIRSNVSMHSVASFKLFTGLEFCLQET